MTTKLIKVLTLISLTLFIVSCSKRIVDAPYSESSTGELSKGTDINYPPAEYSEEGLPKEGTLDDIATNPPVMAEESLQFNIGRTAPGMQPIYFHFDQATIDESMSQILVQNSDYLKENQSLYVIVEGNCDERGAKEYNNALGERRALNTKEFLIGLGIHQNRVRTVSYGEEQPINTESNENAWSQNRRVDFVTE